MNHIKILEIAEKSNEMCVSGQKLAFWVIGTECQASAKGQTCN
jgi:hypothetical protein